MSPKESTQDPTEGMSQEEIELRARIALLEKEAELKKKAADVAIQNAAKALEEANSESDNAKKSNNEIYAIAQMIAVAEQEAACTAEPDEEARETTSVESPPAIVRQDTERPVSPIQQMTSNLSLSDPTDRHTETMESTLDTIMNKIEECTAILSNPNASVAEHLEAAKLATQYAKAAKALNNAM